MDIKKYLQNLDWWLVGAVCLLSLFGLICIASATRINLGESPCQCHQARRILPHRHCADGDCSQCGL